MTIRQKMTERRWGLAGAAVGLLTLAAWGAGARDGSLLAETSPPQSSHDGRAEASADSILVVPVASAVASDAYRLSRTYTGLVAAARTSQLGFERSARVVELCVDMGDTVQRDDVLARLDTRQLLAQRERLQAERDQAIALLEELHAGPRDEAIQAARAEVVDWESQLELQQRVFSRTRELVRKNAVSQERNDEAELGMKSVAAKLQAARERLNELEAGTRKEQILAQQAVVKQLDASLANLDIEISDSELKAPFDGTISARHVDEGTVVAAAQAIFEIVEIAGLEAHIGLPPRIFADLSCGQLVDVEVGGRKWPATFDRAAAVVELRTRTRIAIFDLDASAAGRVVPGEVARVSFSQWSPERGFWVPTRALLRGTRGLWALYVVEPAHSTDRVDEVGEVTGRDVEVMHTDGERSYVRGTLQAGERVIVSGTQRVVPGQRVRPLVEASSPSRALPAKQRWDTEQRRDAEQLPVAETTNAVRTKK